jgi:hypothetical protein
MFREGCQVPRTKGTVCNLGSLGMAHWSNPPLEI